MCVLREGLGCPAPEGLCTAGGPGQITRMPRPPPPPPEQQLSEVTVSPLALAGISPLTNPRASCMPSPCPQPLFLFPPPAVPHTDTRPLLPATPSHLAHTFVVHNILWSTLLTTFPFPNHNALPACPSGSAFASSVTYTSAYFQLVLPLTH